MTTTAFINFFINACRMKIRNKPGTDKAVGKSHRAIYNVNTSIFGLQKGEILGCLGSDG